MRINYGLKGKERKALVEATGKVLDVAVKYMGTPHYGFQVGEYTIDKEGVLIGADNRELVANLLRLHNFIPVGEEYDEAVPSEAQSGEVTDDTPSTITLELPFNTHGKEAEPKRNNFCKLIESKANLIKKALGENGTGELPVVFTDTSVKCEWLQFGIDEPVTAAWSAFLAAAVKFSVKAQRVTAKETDTANEKFSFRAFLVRIGMNDTANKAHRRELLKNLPGDAAFATVESKERWQAKHSAKKSAATEPAQPDGSLESVEPVNPNETEKEEPDDLAEPDDADDENEDDEE